MRLSLRQQLAHQEAPTPILQARRVLRQEAQQRLRQPQPPQLSVLISTDGVWRNSWLGPMPRGSTRRQPWQPILWSVSNWRASILRFLGRRFILPTRV